MKNMKRIIITIFCLQWIFTVASCQKPPPEPPSKIPTSKFPTNLEVVWLSPWCLDSAGGDYIWDFEVANEQYIVVANMYDGTTGRPRGVGVYNMQTGQRHPAWQNEPGGIFGVGEYENVQDCRTAGKNKEIILIYSAESLFGYNLHNGQRMWKFNFPNNMFGIPHISANGDYAFVSYGYEKSWSRLAMVNVYSGERRDVLQLEIEEKYEFDINPPSAYTNSNGDTLLYFTTDVLDFTQPVRYRADAYCYNLTKKQMLWENK